MTNKEKLKSRIKENPASIDQFSYHPDARVRKNSDAGLPWAPVGAIDSAVKVGANTPVRVYNGNAAVQFVIFGDASVAAPTGAADGIPVKAGESVVFNSGLNAYVRGSVATLFAYTAE
jgi:hypothetical protein